MSAGPTAEDHEALLARVADLERIVGGLEYLPAAVRGLRTDVDDCRADLGELEQEVTGLDLRNEVTELQLDIVDLRNEVTELQLDIERLEREKADL